VCKSVLPTPAASRPAGSRGVNQCSPLLPHPARALSDTEGPGAGCPPVAVHGAVQLRGRSLLTRGWGLVSFSPGLFSACYGLFCKARSKVTAELAAVPKNLSGAFPRRAAEPWGRWDSLGGTRQLRARAVQRPGELPKGTLFCPGPAAPGKRSLGRARGHPPQETSRRERAGKPLSLPPPKPGAVWAFRQVCEPAG